MPLSIYRNSSLLYHQAGWLFLCSLRPNLIRTIGTADFRRWCPVFGISVAEVSPAVLCAREFRERNMFFSSRLLAYIKKNAYLCTRFQKCSFYRLEQPPQSRNCLDLKSRFYKT